jgi:uncharacterized protein YecE (DUF72 family)
MQVWVGTCGYSFPDWVGPFYPPGTGSDRMLKFYGTHFQLSDICGTGSNRSTSARSRV